MPTHTSKLVTKMQTRFDSSTTCQTYSSSVQSKESNRKLNVSYDNSEEKKFCSQAKEGYLMSSESLPTLNKTRSGKVRKMTGMLLESKITEIANLSQTSTAI